MVKCRKNDYCQYGFVVDDEDFSIDKTDYDAKRCFKCMANNYRDFEPVD